MKRFFRWLFILFVTFVVLTGIASGVAWYYKPELTQIIHEKIRENINGEFNIDKVSVSVFKDFPQVSVTLEGIYLRGLRYELYKRDFLKARKITVNFDIARLFLKEIDVKSIRISEAEVFGYKTKSGYTNLDIFKKDTLSLKGDTVKGSSMLLNIHTVIFDDVSVTYQDSSKGKSFGFRFVKGKNEIIDTDSSRQFHYNGKIEFDRLQFSEVKGGYLLSKTTEASLNGEFTGASHRLTVFPSRLKFDKSAIRLSGGFHFIPEGDFHLDISSDNMDYTEGRSLIPRSLSEKLQVYNIDAPFGLNVHINGRLKGGDPKIDLDFTTRDALITVDKLQATHVSTKGSFTNHVDDDKEYNDPNSKIEISDFDGTAFGFPVKAHAVFKNLRDPLLELSATITADAAALEQELDTSVFRVRGGKVTSTIAYTGKLNDLADPARRMNSGKFTGTAGLSNVELFWVPRKLAFNKVNGTVAFNWRQFEINQFSFLVNKSPVSITGKVDGFITLLSHPDKKAFVHLLISSADLNTTTLFPETVKIKKAVVSKAKKNKAISDMIDKVYDRLEFDLTLNIKKYQHRNFKASGISGNLVLKNNQLQANPLRMTLAGGEVDVMFRLSELSKPNNPLWIQANVHKADIREFFYGFNNFKQRTINSENLSGKISTNVSLTATMDEDFNVLMPSIAGNVDLTVKDGKLTNFAPLEKLSNFLFKNRDFSEVQFAEIKSSFEMKGTELSISRMEVESSVMSIFIEGRFSLADSTDLSIQLPLSNLKHRDKNYKPANVGVDTKVGPSVFLRARPDEKGNMGIAYDPFKKFRKKK